MYKLSLPTIIVSSTLLLLGCTDASSADASTTDVADTSDTDTNITFDVSEPPKDHIAGDDIAPDTGRIGSLELQIMPNPDPSSPGLSAFTKHVKVLDLSIYAESGVNDANILHAANILAELLDNDENGTVDDPALWEILKQNNALVPIFNAEGSPAETTFFLGYQGTGVSAVLYNTEMDPTQPGAFGADATVEEILHTINAVGHTAVYPGAFGLEPGSSILTQAMDIARAGQFLGHPGTYPDDAWYHYDDTTCDYRCMAIEYLYWAIVTNMGILDDPTTCADIADEWEPCSKDLLMATDTLVYNLITDPAYALPQRAPDGTYAPSPAR